MSAVASGLLRRRWAVPLIALLMLLPATAVLITVVKAPEASAHGSAIDPPARAYSCWKRWGDRWQAPEMKTEDPMCDQAWRADPNAMWNWNGLYQDGVGGNHQRAVPDGQLCSGGRTAGGRYNALDEPGPWHAVPLSNSFRVTVHDAARHGADYYRIYVTKQGFDPLTQRLGWGDLDLVAETGRFAPGAGTPGNDEQLNGVSVSMNASAPGRTGRHIVYTIWQASHSDQSYYFCSDVIFGGAGGGGADPVPQAPPETLPPAPPTTTPPPSLSPAAPPSTTGPTPPAPAVPPAPGAGGGPCTASYRVVNQWPDGFQGEVTVAAGSGPVDGWTVGMAFPNGQTVTQAWNSVVDGSGSSVQVANASWNGRIPAGGSTSFGFLGRWQGANDAPRLTCNAP